ncbi:hypothetical protein UJ101_00946 [Flavobacteriaceae bacterium UJ101]|nr:hypothetical protein UJ101_00946 [Flavobacteriaceae bacterium UJ101]
MKYLKLLFIYIFFLSSCITSREERDLINKLNRVEWRYSSQKTINSIEVIRLDALKKDFPTALGKANLALAYAYYNKNDYNNFLKYAIEANKTLPQETYLDKLLYTKSILAVAIAYYSSDHIIESLDYINNVYSNLDNLPKNDNTLMLKGLTYNVESDIQNTLNHRQEAYNFLLKSKKVLKKNSKNTFVPYVLTSTYNKLSLYHFKEKNLDSSFLYANEALNKSINIDYALGSGISWMNLANIHFHKKDYSQALMYYKKSAKKFDSVNAHNQLDKTYSKLNSLFLSLNDSINASKYYFKHLILRNQINKKEKLLRIFANHEIANNFEESLERTKAYYTILILSVLILTSFLFYYLLKNKQKRLSRKRNIIQKDERKINQLESEISTLKDQYLDELLTLIKKDDQLFLAKFTQIYPDFILNLKKHSGELTSQDLKFCALVKLNFSTKEIADMLFISVKSVDVKRYRIRKKLKLTSKTNFDKWINNI